MNFYEEAIPGHDAHWAIQQAYACPPVCKMAQIQGLNTSKMRISGGDFSQKELQRQLEREANLHSLCLITREHMEGPTVVFMASVSAAKAAAQYLTNNYGIRAGVVYGVQDPDERQAVISGFRAGDIEVLCNVAVVATGFDHPETTTLILGRPTRSSVFWLQCAGRAMRPYPAGVIDVPGLTAEDRKKLIAASSKPYFKIVDTTDSSLDHRIVTSVDMFCNLEDKKEREAAKKILINEKENLTPEELAEKAREEEEKRKKAELLEKMRDQVRGSATGNVVSEEFLIGSDGKRSVGTYFNPLKGKFAGKRMAELPEYYLTWGCNNPKLTAWIRGIYRKEQRRRYEIARDKYRKSERFLTRRDRQ